MMQSFASSAKFLGSGPILHAGVEAIVTIGMPLPRIDIDSPSHSCRVRDAMDSVNFLRCHCWP